MIESIKNKIPRAIRPGKSRVCHCMKCGYEWVTKLKAPARPKKCPEPRGCGDGLWWMPYKYETYGGRVHDRKGAGTKTSVVEVPEPKPLDEGGEDTR